MSALGRPRNAWPKPGTTRLRAAAISRLPEVRTGTIAVAHDLQKDCVVDIGRPATAAEHEKQSRLAISARLRYGPWTSARSGRELSVCAEDDGRGSGAEQASR